MFGEHADSRDPELDPLPIISSTNPVIYRCMGGIATWSRLDLL